MKILMGHYWLTSYRGGIRTWMLTMQDALLALGHEAHVFIHKCKIAPELQYRVTTKIDSAYDLIICNTAGVLNHLRKVKGKKIFMLHGIYDPPIRGADYYIAVSEEAGQYSKRCGLPISAIIRNPIDCEKIKYIGCGKSVKTIAAFSYRRQFPFMQELKELGFSIIEIGFPRVSMPEALAMLAGADLVIAAGRCAYEAMAMGKNVIVSHDNSNRSGIELMDGFVNDKTFFEFRHNNLSGRCKKIPVDSIDVFLREVEKYDQSQGERNRALILKNNNSLNVAKQFLTFAEA